MMQPLRALLVENGRYPIRRTFERRLRAMPETLPAQIVCLGRHLLLLIDPFRDGGPASAIDSTALAAHGGSGTRSIEVLGAVLVYQLALLHRFKSGDDLRVGLKPHLQAA